VSSRKDSTFFPKGPDFAVTPVDAEYVVRHEIPRYTRSVPANLRQEPISINLVDAGCSDVTEAWDTVRYGRLGGEWVLIYTEAFSAQGGASVSHSLPRFSP
jgi:hypothetical protein